MSSETAGHAWANRANDFPIVTLVFAPLRVLLAMPVPLFLVTLTVMLLRPPEIEFYSVDRIAFLVLAGTVVLRALALRQSLFLCALSWPMLGLSGLAAASALHNPYEVQTWSVMAAKFLVPFTLFHLAGLVFDNDEALRWLERFALVVLAYLSFTAVAFLASADAFIFPRFILDPGLGIHVDRARGPFLQAVANGVSLNLLGLIAIDGYRRGRMRGIWALALLGSLPLAILATKTRGVWLSFVVSVGWVLIRFNSMNFKSLLKWLMVAGAVGAILLLALGDGGGAFTERLQESSPVEFRIAAYRAGWNMFLERPLSGWGTSQLQSELAHRIDGFKGDTFVVHNTYLEILIEHGVLGFGLYAWLLVGLLKLGRWKGDETEESFGGAIRALWPLLLGVYLVNSTFVVMNYQFVNGLLFTLAGILAARNRYVGQAEDIYASAA